MRPECAAPPRAGDRGSRRPWRPLAGGRADLPRRQRGPLPFGWSANHFQSDILQGSFLCEQKPKRRLEPCFPQRTSTGGGHAALSRAPANLRPSDMQQEITGNEQVHIFNLEHTGQFIEVNLKQNLKSEECH